MLKEGQKITRAVYLDGIDETGFQKLFSIEKMEFDNCQAPKEEIKNYKLSWKQCSPRLAEAEASHKTMARRCWLAFLDCSHAEL